MSGEYETATTDKDYEYDQHENIYRSGIIRQLRSSPSNIKDKDRMRRPVRYFPIRSLRFNKDQGNERPKMFGIQDTEMT